MQRSKRSWMCLWMLAVCASCSDPASPAVSPPLPASEIDRLAIFVRDWPNNAYVEIDFRRRAAGSTLVMFRPSPPGVPRLLIDSIGPVAEDPQEITELVNTYNVWALADSNAAGAACSTRSGQWVCNITDNDYSVVMLVQSGGTQRAQRYTRLETSAGNPTARAMGNYVLAMMRRRTGTASAARGM